MCFPFFHKYGKWTVAEWDYTYRRYIQHRTCPVCGKTQERTL